MKKLQIVLGLALGGFLLTSPASAAKVEWRGGGYMKFLTQACYDDGFDPIEYVSARFRPKGLADNGDQNRLSFFHPLFFASSYRTQRNLTKTYRPVDGGGTGSATWLFENTVKMKARSTPSDVKTDTDSVRIVGNIKNYGDTAGCNVGFDVNLTRRP